MNPLFKTPLVGLAFLLSTVHHSLAQDTSAGRTAAAAEHTYALLWQQHASEYKALCYQAYNLAALRLGQVLKRRSRFKKPLCVVVDIDETIFDNSPFQGHEIQQNKDYDRADWETWVSKAAAQPVPGCLKFLNFAKSKNVDVFYITNRGFQDAAITLANLQKDGFPYADGPHLLCARSSSNKEPRRRQVAKYYHISLLCGDNLNDFTDLFYHKDEKPRTAAADSMEKVWGDRFIVLPNPIYGDWESALYHYDTRLQDKDREKIRKEDILGF